MIAAEAPVRSDKATTTRIQSVDLLRGAIMMIMALDHIRDFFHASAYQFNPEDLTKTSAILFFTRWITHFCAPLFVFLSGTSVHLSACKRNGRGEVARHLIARGLWLIFLEFTALEFMWTFNFHYQMVMLQVIWAIGWSMIVLAGLIWLPRRAIAAIAVGMIVLHNAFDSVKPAAFGSMGWLWSVLHVPTPFQEGHTLVFALYPLIPWIGVFAAGYCFGPILQLNPVRRRRVLVRLGLALTAAFFILRGLNVYGDPLRWSPQPSFEFTVLSFLRTNKYPPSLLYLLMTIGPGILALGLLDTLRVSEKNPFRVFGRVPMFYYICHFYLLHAVAVLLSGLRYGHWDYFLHFPGKLLGLPDANFPNDWGYNLAEVYLIWIGIVAALYLPCLWFMRVKQRSRSPWLSYI